MAIIINHDLGGLIHASNKGETMGNSCFQPQDIGVPYLQTNPFGFFGLKVENGGYLVKFWFKPC